MVTLLAGLFFICLECAIWDGHGIFGERDFRGYSTHHFCPIPLPSNALCVLGKVKNGANFMTAQVWHLSNGKFHTPRAAWPKPLTPWPSGFYANVKSECWWVGDCVWCRSFEVCSGL